MIRRAVVVLLVALAGCVGGEPRRPGGSELRRIEPEYGPDRRAAAEPDPWSVDAALPRSGDPTRPNVKVELTTLDVVSTRGLFVRAGVRGSIVRGIVNVRAALAAGAGETRARSRTATFVIVQAGRAGAIALTDDGRRWCGPWAGLHVEVLRAGPEGVHLALAPYVAPTARPGEVVEGATEVTLQPGEAVLLGGSSSDDARETRGTGGYAERAERRELLVLLQVDVLG